MPAWKVDQGTEPACSALSLPLIRVGYPPTEDDADRARGGELHALTLTSPAAAAAAPGENLPRSAQHYLRLGAPNRTLHSITLGTGVNIRPIQETGIGVPPRACAITGRRSRRMRRSRAASQRGLAQRAHPPVFGLVPIVYTLVILSGPERRDALTNAEHEVRQLGTFEPLLDHHPVARRPEAALAHDRGHRGVGRRGIRGNDHAFAGGETVGFEHDRKAELPGREERHRVLGGLGHVIRGGWHAVSCHERLRERLAGLEAAAACVGPTMGSPADENRRPRHGSTALRADDRQSRTDVGGQGCRRVGIVAGKRLNRRDVAHPRIAGAQMMEVAQDPVRDATPGVFATTSTEDEEFMDERRGGIAVVLRERQNAQLFRID